MNNSILSALFRNLEVVMSMASATCESAVLPMVPTPSALVRRLRFLSAYPGGSFS